MLRGIDCVMVPVRDLNAAVDFYERQTISGVHDLVDNVIAAVGQAVDASCTVTVEPLDVAMGMSAALADSFGNPVYLLDMCKGPRNLARGA